MTAEEWQEIKPQLHEVLMLDPGLRADGMEHLVLRYPALRDELEALAASFREIPDEYLAPEGEWWWSGQAQAETSVSSLIGTRMGAYETTGPIGVGGMGEVFRARRADSVYEKQVAIKVVRAGQDSAFILSRFRQERQILAGLDHPNIARLLDGGTSSQGLPYFVMELIEGTRITDYCEQHALVIEERLKLFIAVCRAIQYAHQQGVIHRDIKPGNILVTGEGIPKLLDFGIAKLLEPGSGSSSVTSTISMFRPLTPAYASPEQISGGPITTSTDIYSLGVVLYELLCGRIPYATSGGATGDLARAVCEADPPPPSKEQLNALPASGEGRDDEQHRHPTRERLKRLRGDLDTIVMTALRKEPERRYASAEALARDIELHLERRPIRARRDSPLYRATKFARRNPAPLLTTAALLTAGASGIAIFQWHSRPAPVPPQDPIHVRPSVAVLGFRNVNAGRESSWISPALSDVLSRTLAAGGQFRAVSPEVVAKSKLDLGIGEMEAMDQAQANRIYSVIDSDYLILGSFSVMNDEIRLDLRAQNARTGETAASVSESGSGAALADIALRAGADLRKRLGIADLTPAELQSLSASFPKAPDAMRSYSEGIAKLNGLDAQGASTALLNAITKEPAHALSHEALSSAWSMLGYEARAADEAKKAAGLSGELSRPDQLLIEARYDDTLHQKAKALEIDQTLFRLFPDDIEFGLRLADAETENGKGNDALETVKSLRKLPDPIGRDPRIDLAEANAASSLGDYQLGKKAAAQAMRGAEQEGARSIVALACLRQGVALRHIKDFQHAQQSFRSAIPLYQSIGNLRGVASAWNGLGNIDRQQGNLAASRNAYEQAIDANRQVGDRSDMAGIMGNLANVVGDQGDIDGSMNLYRQELSLAREIDDRRMIAETLNNIGVIEVLQGRLAQGSGHFEQSIGILRDLGDIDSVAVGLDSLGGAQLLRGNIADAIKSFDEELSDFRTAGDDQAVAYALSNLGSAMALSGDLTGAEQKLLQALAMSRQSGEKHYIAQNLTQLGMVHFYNARDQEARKEFEEAIAIHDEMGEKFTQEETWLDFAQLELAQSHYDQAASLAHQALQQARNEHMPDAQLVAHEILARVLIRQHQPTQAQAELSSSERLAAGTQNLATRLMFTVAKAEVARPALAPKLRRDLQSAAVDAHQHGLVPYEYEAVLWLEIANASSHKADACQRLNALRNDAANRAFQRIAASADSACR
jgi:serine/threonine protein kinase/tetratricopeptide (TPR) repeat protein